MQPGLNCPLVLVVEDEPSIRDAVAEVLAMEGFLVETAANGADALRIVQASPPRLVVLDMRMPVMDGWTFARELKARGLQIPVLVLTAAFNARRWAEEVGAARYLPKPFDVVDLIDTVNELCSADRRDTAASPRTRVSPDDARHSA
jgi:CheY-like chemotaxis protein